MSETVDKMALIRLDPVRDEKLDQIAKAMTRDLGVKVSRTAAVRRLIDLYTLRPVDRTMDAVTDNAA